MKRVCIVFEETDQIGAAPGGEGPLFNIYLEGVDKEKLRLIPESEWSTADYWGVKCFNIVLSAIAQTGAVESVRRKP